MSNLQHTIETMPIWQLYAMAIGFFILAMLLAHKNKTVKRTLAFITVGTMLAFGSLYAMSAYKNKQSLHIKDIKLTSKLNKVEIKEIL